MNEWQERILRAPSGREMRLYRVVHAVTGQADLFALQDGTSRNVNKVVNRRAIAAIRMTQLSVTAPSGEPCMWHVGYLDLPVPVAVAETEIDTTVLTMAIAGAGATDLADVLRDIVRLPG